jgi:UDP-2,3-diacylglucosamine hydrolase
LYSSFYLGDLFETWIGDDDDLPIHIEIKQALKAFTTNGPETFFIHGNRDFLVGEAFAKETGIPYCQIPTLLKSITKKSFLVMAISCVRMIKIILILEIK